MPSSSDAAPRSRATKQPVRLGLRWIVEATNTWWSNYGQLRRNTDRRNRHRHAALCLATVVLIVGKLITWRDRWSPPDHLSAQVLTDSGVAAAANGGGPVGLPHKMGCRWRSSWLPSESGPCPGVSGSRSRHDREGAPPGSVTGPSPPRPPPMSVASSTWS